MLLAWTRVRIGMNARPHRFTSRLARRLATLNAFIDIARLGCARERLSVLADGGIRAAFFHKARFCSASQGLSILADRLTRAGLRVDGAGCESCKKEGDCDTFHERLPGKYV
jgi:hypothetical protein